VKPRGDHFQLLLRAYPKAYREQRGDEILATLLEDVSTNGSYENVRVGIDIVGHGLRLRAGIASDQLAGQVLIAAALPGMTMAAVAALVMPVFGQVVPDVRFGPSSWGPDTAIWPALCIFWIIGCVAALIFPKQGRYFAAACVVATAIVRFLVPIGPWGLPPGFLLLAALSVPCLIAPRTSPRRSHRRFALLVGAVVLGTLVGVAASSSWIASGGPIFYSEFDRCAPYVGVTVILCSAVLLGARRWTLGSGLALLAIPWLLLPVADPGPVALTSTVSALSVAAVCVIGLGLVGLWLSERRMSHESLRG
jgi:hypothetical protein